jgi:hypothetical protein
MQGRTLLIFWKRGGKIKLKSGLFWAAAGLSRVVRVARAGCLRAAVAPKVASSPRGSIRLPPCGQPVQSLPRAIQNFSVLVEKKVSSMRLFNRPGLQRCGLEGNVFNRKPPWR